MSVFVLIALPILITILVSILFIKEGKQYIIKGLIIALSFILISGMYFTFHQYKGWPSNHVVVNKAIVLYADINRPTIHSPGSIYLWVEEEFVPPTTFFNKLMNILTYNEPNNPRVITIPYSDEKAEEMLQTLNAIREGNIAQITPKGNEESGEGESNGNYLGYSENFEYDVEIIDPRELMEK